MPSKGLRKDSKGCTSTSQNHICRGYVISLALGFVDTHTTPLSSSSIMRDSSCVIQPLLEKTSHRSTHLSRRARLPGCGEVSQGGLTGLRDSCNENTRGKGRSCWWDDCITNRGPASRRGGRAINALITNSRYKRQVTISKDQVTARYLVPTTPQQWAIYSGATPVISLPPHLNIICLSSPLSESGPPLAYCS